MPGMEWSKETVNFVTGCTKISPGCANCYAERLANGRLKRFYPNGFSEVKIHPDRLSKPLTKKKPTEFFVNSMSDLFHKDIPFDFLLKIFDVMGNCPQHKFQILTKRAKRLAELAPKLKWHPNIWMGVSVENQDYVWRIEYLSQVPVQIKFVSAEPLLGDINFGDQIKYLDWMVVGSESGPKARKMNLDWARSIRDQCLNANVPFFFKQGLLDGQEWDQKPNLVKS